MSEYKNFLNKNFNFVLDMLYNDYKDTDLMSDVICDEPALLKMMARFNLPLGVGDKTVRQVCEENQVDYDTFLAVANFIKHGARGASNYLDKISVKCLIEYLKQAHIYFLEYQFPSIRRKLLEALDCSQSGEVSFLILKYYDDYIGELRKHMQYENRKVFTYVDELLEGKREPSYSISQFARAHSSIDVKLQELKNIIIKYYAPTEKEELLNTVLYDIFTGEVDLRMHNGVENELFVPAVQILEDKVQTKVEEEENQKEVEDFETPNSLSDRECEIVRCVVRGLSNKQIAEKLFISFNTVLTHRKNIARKLNIHSIAGLTIYAIVNKIVDIKDVEM